METFNGDVRDFLSLVSKFPNLEQLSLVDAQVPVDGKVTGAELRTTLRNVTILSLRNHGVRSNPTNYSRTEFYELLVRALQNQLSSLDFNQEFNTSFAFTDSLHSISVHCPCEKVMTSMSKLSSIKHACLNVYPGCDSCGNKSDCALKFISQMISEHKFINHLSIGGCADSCADDDDFWQWFRCVELALTETPNRKSNSLFIELDGGMSWNKRIHTELLNMVHCLEKTNVKSWRLKCRIFCWDYTEDDEYDGPSEDVGVIGAEVDAFVDDLDDLQSDYLVHYQHELGELMIVISNKDCKICGY